jgi:hypothetical protein
VPLVIAIGLLSLAGIGFLVVDESDGGGSDDPPSTVAEQPAGHEAHGFFGVAPQAPLDDTDWDRMRDGGVEIVRVPLNWNNVQSAAGDCEPAPAVNACQWTEFDRIVGAAAIRGIRIVPTLGGRPEFASDSNSHKFVREHPPTEGEPLEAWRDFVNAAAGRYGRDGTFWKKFGLYAGEEAVVPIEEWQVWNEPNAAAYWPPEPDPVEYATLVRETSSAIRDADAKAEIVLAGMFGTATIDSTDFLSELYAVDGIEESFDSIAIHPYSPSVHGIEVQAEWARDVAAEAGDEEVGLWATELGWGSGEDGHELEVGEEMQAELLEESFQLFLDNREEWNVEGVTWFTWRDVDESSVCRFCRNAGLFDADQHPKPAWAAFESFTKGGSG